MSSEIQFSGTASASKRNSAGTCTLVTYQKNYSLSVDMAGSSGPYGGAMTASLGGTFVPIPTGVTPGLALFTNQDCTNKIYVGLYDNSTGRFLPFLRLLPGMTQMVYLAEALREWSGVAPGTGSLGSDQLMIKATGSAATCLVEIFPE